MTKNHAETLRAFICTVGILITLIFANIAAAHI